MCNHKFVYPMDTVENYNSDGKTLKGRCKICGLEKNSYGIKWIIPLEEEFIKRVPYGETLFCNFVEEIGYEKSNLLNY